MMQMFGKRMVHEQPLRHPPHGLGKQNPVPVRIFLHIIAHVKLGETKFEF